VKLYQTAGKRSMLVLLFTAENKDDVWHFGTIEGCAKSASHKLVTKQPRAPWSTSQTLKDKFALEEIQHQEAVAKEKWATLNAEHNQEEQGLRVSVTPTQGNSVVPITPSLISPQNTHATATQGFVRSVAISPPGQEDKFGDEVPDARFKFVVDSKIVYDWRDNEKQKTYRATIKGFNGAAVLLSSPHLGRYTMTKSELLQGHVRRFP